MLQFLFLLVVNEFRIIKKKRYIVVKKKYINYILQDESVGYDALLKGRDFLAKFVNPSKINSWITIAFHGNVSIFGH